MRLQLTWVVAFFATLQFSFAQEKSVSGTVTDESGIPLPGVAILVKESTKGTQTDFDGNYQISVQEGETLVFSYVGMKSAERKVGGNDVINVMLKTDAQELEAVVVTAMGVTRSEKSLGYATQEVKGDDLSKAGQQNAISALSGSVAGVQITAPSSMGGSTRITMRGIGSVTGDNRPLIVVDGIPLDNSNYNSGNTQRGAGGRDYGDAAADINPDDIESVTVLKGGPATALYGSRGGNGVIVYTTKSGKNGKSSIDIKSGATWESIYIYPQLQNLYGGGSNNTFSKQVINGKTYNIASYAVDESWGPKYDGTPYLPWYAFNKEFFPEVYLKEVPWQASSNDIDSFFNSGLTLSNSIALTKSVKDTNMRLSLANSHTEGIVPNTRLEKTNISFNFGSSLSDRLKMDGSFNYVLTQGFNRQEVGYGDNSVAQKMFQWTQRQLDFDKLRKYYTLPTGQQQTWNRSAWDDATPKYSDNLYWIVNKNTSDDKRHRFFGNVGLTYNFTDNLYAVAKAYGDVYSFRIQERVAVGSQAQSKYEDIIRQRSDYNYEGRLHYEPEIGEDFSLNMFLGMSRRQEKYDYVRGETIGGLVQADYYNLANSKEQPKAADRQTWRRTNSVFGMASFGYKDMLFLETTGRQDWFSTVSEPVFYPSVTGSFIFSSVVKASWLSFGKLRLGWAQVGNDANPYSLETYPEVNTAFLNAPRYSNPSTVNNPELKPEVKTTKEIGLDVKLFHNRLGFDVTYYDIRTHDLIIPLAVDPAGGFSYRYVNAGEMKNQGIEAVVTVAPIRTSDFSWDITWNFAKNNNELVSLYPGTPRYQLGSAPFKATLYAIEGQKYGQILGEDYVYKDGKRVVNSKGQYKASEIKSLGSILPDYNMGLRNSIKYKNLSLSFLFDFQKGGKYYSVTHLWGMYSGMLEETAANGIREKGIILDGVFEDGKPNDKKISAKAWSHGFYNSSQAQNVFDATYLKLRDVSLSYSVPLPDKKYIKALTFSVYGRNLWTTGLDWKGMDPEMASYGSGNIQGLEGGSLPSTRTYGMNVQIKL